MTDFLHLLNLQIYLLILENIGLLFLINLLICLFLLIDINYKNNLDAKASFALNELLQSQTQYVADLKPTDIFYDTFEELLNINKICVINLQRSRSSPAYGQNFVGYYDEDKKIYYLYPEAVYNAVENHYCNNFGKKFPINAKTLWRYLAEEGLLDRGKSYEEQNRYAIPKIINGKKGKFLPLKERIRPFENIEVIGRVPYTRKLTTTEDIIRQQQMDMNADIF